MNDMKYSIGFLLTLMALLLPGISRANGGIDLEPILCLEVDEHPVVRARVNADVPGSTVRVYFRRLHEVVEDFYWVELRPQGGGDYWGVLPRPTDDELDEKETQRLLEDRERLELQDRLSSEDMNDLQDWPHALWWRLKEVRNDRNPEGDLDQKKIDERASEGRLRQRHWMDKLSNEELQRFLDEQKHEPAEYYGAVYDAYGNLVAVSDVEVSEVRGKCNENKLTEREEGLAENLVVGETAIWQIGEEVFHWRCEGVVTRIDYEGIFRGDDVCRACVIAWWKKKSFLIPAAAGTTGIAVVESNEPRRASPSRP